MKRITLALFLMILSGIWSFGQQPVPKKEESHKYRVIFTLAGAGGGFTLGTFAGIGAFEDSANATKKVWTTALISATGGAVAGYFLGRALDKRKKSKDITWIPKPVPEGLNRSFSRANWPAMQPIIVPCSPNGQDRRLLPCLYYPTLAPAAHGAARSMTP